MTPTGWDVVIPLKDVARAKTRLTVLGDRWRETFARAMFLDTVEAVTCCPLRVRVHAVTDDLATIAELATFPGSVVVHTHAPSGLNEALGHAVSMRSVDKGWGTVALLGDLPSLTGQALAEVIERAGETRSVVPDAEETGTTMLVVAAGRPLLPSFGAGSLARHVASGARTVAAPAGARHDVDKPEDLWSAWRLGVGSRTEWSLQRLCGTGLIPAELPAAG